MSNGNKLSQQEMIELIAEYDPDLAYWYATSPILRYAFPHIIDYYDITINETFQDLMLRCWDNGDKAVGGLYSLNFRLLPNKAGEYEDMLRALSASSKSWYVRFHAARLLRWHLESEVGDG